MFVGNAKLSAAESQNQAFARGESAGFLGKSFDAGLLITSAWGTNGNYFGNSCAKQIFVFSDLAV